MAAYRKKLYYPEYQIQKNLFTKGGEWMTLDDWKEYVGFYHRYETGEIFTEKEWNPNTSKKLVKYIDRDKEYFKYLDLKHYMVVNGQKQFVPSSERAQYARYVAPRAVKRRPNEIESENGVMNRYFIYKRNEPLRVFFEIDEAQVQNYNTDHTGINQYLYGLITLPWKIDGPEYDIIKNNIIVTPGVVDTNKRIVLQTSKKFSILQTILNNPREFSKYDK
ncbi:hypothetical protein [Microcystis phage Mel-JY01]